MKSDRSRTQPALCRRFIGPFLATIFGVACWHPKMTRACVTNADLDPASKAILAPVVILGRLESVEASWDHDNRFYASFRVQKTFKANDLKGNLKKKEVVQVMFANSSGVTNSRRPGVTKLPTKNFDFTTVQLCAVSARELRKNERYLVYATIGSPRKSSNSGTRTSLVAMAYPDVAASPSSRAVRKALCKGCAKPPGVSGLGNISVEPKKKLKLQCRITGNPAPKVEWFKDRKKLKNNKRIKIRTKKKFSRLEIAQVRAQDSGEYTCRASNIMAKSPISISAKVTVWENPSQDPQSPFKGRPCSFPEKEYCLNLGQCLYFPSVKEFSCQCAEGFKGRRCENKDINTQGISRLWVLATKDASPPSTGDGSKLRKDKEVMPKVEDNLFVTIIALVAFYTITLFLVIIYAISRICRNSKKRKERHRMELRNQQHFEESYRSSIEQRRYVMGEIEPLKCDNTREINSAQWSSDPRDASQTVLSSPARRPRLKAVSSVSDVEAVALHETRSSRSKDARRSRTTYSLLSSSSIETETEEVVRNVVNAFQHTSTC